MLTDDDKAAAGLYRSVAEVEDANRRAGYHFFSADALRFFGSRIHDNLYGRAVFVTSELDFYGTERRYTVRLATAGGNIREVGGFQAYGSRSGAHAAAQRAGAELEAFRGAA
jgi:hypothetical protein